MRRSEYLGACIGAVMSASLLTPVAHAADTSAETGRRLPPVIDLGQSPSAATPAPRETLADMLLQMEALQTELRQLRGQVEVQTNEIERLNNRQRELLGDMDQRVRALEKRGPETGATEPPANGNTASPPAAALVVPPPIPAAEQQEYDAAFALLKQGSYERATKSFRDFIARHPKSALADNAQYWIGEAYFVTRNFRQSLVEFTKAANSYPQSPKLPDAMLKIGYCHYELSEWAKSRDMLNKIISQHPASTAAHAAEQRLAKMKKEGH